MKRLLFSVFFLFSLTVFAGSNPCGKLYKLNTSVSPNPKDEYLDFSAGQSTPPPTPASEWVCSYPKYISWSGVTQGAPSGGGFVWWSTRTTTVLSVVTSCPSGTEPDADNICKTPPPPATCSWATTPPYFVTSNTQSTCSNTHKDITNDGSHESYYYNFSWCALDSKCYAREYYCPSGQRFDFEKNECYSPIKPPLGGSGCPDGFYKQSGSITGPAGKSCYIDFICKTDPTNRTRTDVSCGSGPVDSAPETNPDAPAIPDESSSSNNKDHSAKCGTDRMMAQASCPLPQLLTFSCDPTTGLSSSSCKSPFDNTQAQRNSNDSTTASTSEDIKNLSDTLSDNFSKTLANYLTDGNSNHLADIKSSLQQMTTLDADRNDKLDTLIASVDGGLVLQGEANTKLDAVKNSVDNVSSSLNAGGEYTGEDMPSASDLAPDSNTTSGFSTFTDSFDQIKNQFDQAQLIFSQGLPVPQAGSGSCPSYTFYGNEVSLSKIGTAISPFSSIMSILIYISLMIGIFRLVFSFFTRGI